MSDLLTLTFAFAALRISVPYVLAALGGAFCERAGVINLALEGLLLTGALGAALGADAGGVGMGLVTGAAAGVALAGLYALVVLRFGADQIVAGVAINLLALGLSRYVLKLVWGSASSTPTLPGFGAGSGDVVFLVCVVLAVPAMHYLMERTPWGLRVRAVGEHPEAADSLGVPVERVRLFAILLSGLGAGLGGAWLALDNHGFSDKMSGGRGFIALAAMILGRWRPLTVATACLLFGVADAAQTVLQTRATPLPRELIQVLPYLITLIALAGLFGRARAPAAIGRWFTPRRPPPRA